MRKDVNASKTPTTAVERKTVKSSEQADAVVNPIVENVVPQLAHDRGDLLYTRAQDNLRLWFERMEMGNLLDDRTPFYKDVDREVVKNGLWRKVERADSRSQIKIKGYEEAWFETEQGQAENWGPQSQFLPWSEDGPEKVAAVMSDKIPTAALKREALDLALSDIRDLLPPRRLHFTSIQEALTGMGGDPKFALDVKTNSGWPTFKRDWNPKSSPRNEYEAYVSRYIMGRANELYQNALTARSYKDMLLPHFVAPTSQRTVQKGPKPLEKKEGKPLKGKRIVIAMPKDETVAGKTVMSPMQALLSEVRNKASNVRIIPAWQAQPVLDKNVQVFLEFAEAHDRTPLSGDISNFDATVPPWLIWEVAQAMSEWMDKPTANLFLAIMYGDIYQTTVISPTDLYKEGPSSVKSGSIFTSVMGCMCNYAIQRYGHHAGYYNAQQHCVMGDDFIIDGDGVEPESISQAFADFGMECNPSKQFAHRSMVHFLQRLHVLGYPGGQGSVFRIGGNVLSVEDDTQLRYEERNKWAYVFQALARLENGCMNPDFEKMVDFYKAGDPKLHLGADVSVDAILHNAGEYAERRLRVSQLKPWDTAGSGVPFRSWAVNRVLRGDRLPPPGVARFENVYGVKYADLAY